MWSAAVVLLSLQAAPPLPAIEVDPALRAVVERFFATQEAEDTDGYLSLWSARAERPQAQQLKFIFDSGDDRFTDLRITHATVTPTAARVRVVVMRERTDLRVKRPDGTPMIFATPLQLGLSLVREGEAWKIFREGAPVDELAAALIAEGTREGRAALMKAEPDLLTARLVESIARRADGFAQMARYREAQGLYERSLEVARAIGDRKAEGQALGNLANSHYYLREFDRARALHEERLAIERSAANDDGVANALVGIATIHYSVAEYGAALKLYREALTIQERIDDQVLIANTLISTGNVLYLQGDFEAAIVDYRRAETLKRKFFDLGGAAMALEGQGRVFAAQGDLAAALGAFTTVLGERRQQKIGGARQAQTLQSVGDIHFRLGNTDAARTAFDEGRALFETAGDRSSVGRILQAVAINELVAGRPAAGESAYAQSITACSSAKDDECVAHAQVGLGFALAAQRKYVPAIGSYRQGIASFDALAMAEAAGRARVGLAEALSGKEEHAQALKEAVEARRIAVALDADDLLWRALISAARAERRLGRGTEALGSARAALATVRRMAAAALKRPGASVPRDSSAAFATTAVLLAESGDAAAAITAAEEMRALALRGWLAVNERDIARGMTADERDAERALAAELTTLHAQRERERGFARPDQDRLARLDAAIGEAEQRRAAWQEAVFARLPDLRTWRGLAPAAGIEAFEALIDEPSTAFLTFVVDEHDLLILLASRVAKGKPIRLAAHVVTIHQSDLAERVARGLSSTALLSASEWRKGSAELFSVLPPAVISELAGIRTLYVAPDGVLWRVPFEAMPMDGQYLGERMRVAYIPSVSAVSIPPGPSAAAAPGPLLLVTSPALSPETIAQLKVTAPSWMVTVPAHPSAEEAGLERTLGAEASVVLKGAAATAAAVRSAMTSAGTIHLGVPFRVNAASPLFSPILLAPPGVERPGGEHLEARDLFDLTIAAPFVSFGDPSALSMRDGAVALTSIYWAWRAAGVRTLAVRRWGGEDPAVFRVLAAIHEGLRAGQRADEAVFRARSRRADSDPPAPGVWAAWILLGR